MVSALFAEGGASAHEKTNVEDGAPHNSTVMDLLNNAVGRSLPLTLPPILSEVGCQNAVRAALDNESLFVLDNFLNPGEIGLLKPSNR